MTVLQLALAHKKAYSYGDSAGISPDFPFNGAVAPTIICANVKIKVETWLVAAGEDIGRGDLLTFAVHIVGEGQFTVNWWESGSLVLVYNA